MADPWGDIGSFLSQVGQAAGGALSNAGMGAGISLMHGGGLVHGALGGLLGGRRLIDAMMPQARGQYQRVQVKNPDGSTSDAYYDVATGKTQPLGLGESFYDPTKPTKPTGFEEYLQHPKEFAQYGQALHPEAAPMMQLRQQAQKSLEQQREDTLRERHQEHADTEADRALQRRLVAGNEAANRALKSALTKPEKPQISWRWESTPDGKAVQQAYRFNPATGEEEPVKTQGYAGGIPARLNAGQQKQVDQIHEVKNSIPTLQGYVAALPSNLTPAMMAREYAKYRTHGLLGIPDPRFTDYFDTLGQMKTALIGARIGGISRAKSVIDQLSPHIPDPTDMPALAMRKLHTFDEGAFNASLGAILGNPQHSSSAPAATGVPSTLGAATVSPDETPPPSGFVE